MQKSYKRFFSKRTKIINVQLTKNKKKNEQQIMDKNRKVKQQSFEYNNKNVRIKSNQVISKPSKTIKIGEEPSIRSGYVNAQQ